MKTVNVHIPEAEHFNRSSDSVRLLIIYQHLLKLELRALQIRCESCSADIERPRICQKCLETEP